MPSITEVVLGGSAVYLLYLLIKYRDRAIGIKRRPDAPGPRGFPILGNLPFALWNGPRMLEKAVKLRVDHGLGACVTFPGIRMWDISRPDWIEYVQKTNFENYIKGGMFEEVMSDVLGEGIFVVDGPRWSLTRKTTSHIFNARNFKGVISPAIDGCLSTLNQIISRHAKNGTSFDFADLCFRLTLESFSKMAFGQSVGALTTENDAPVPFAVAFDYAQGRMNHRFNMVIGWHWYELLTPHGRKMKESCRYLDEYAYKIIDARQVDARNPKEKTKEELAARDLLGLYMDARDDQGRPMTRTQLKESVLNLLIAGRDTTAQALSWIFWRLLMDKRHIEPMREEIERVLGPTGAVTYDNYRSLIQVQAVFSEGLRLHPSVPKNAKFSVAADQLPNGGPRIDAGDGVRWSDWQMARDPEVWGPDCREFKPSRFIDESGRLKQYGQWKMHAFNGGPRICLGMNLATFEAVGVIVELVRNFDLDFAPGWWESVEKTGGVIEGNPEPMYGFSVTLPMKHPMLLTARKR